MSFKRPAGMRALVPPKLNSKRASLGLSKIDGILVWERSLDSGA
jgi:hypothetical protein